MKCYKQSPYLRKAGVHIDNIWEVRIPIDLWQRVQAVATVRKLTYSWVTRYCVFRLVRKKSLRMFPAMEKLSELEKETYHGALAYHRHQICLYGGDEKLLRLTAIRLDMTVSRLIRLALLWFLRHFECQPRLNAWRRNGLYHASIKEIDACTAPRGVKLKRWRQRLRWAIGFSRMRVLSAESVFWFGIKLVKSVAVSCNMEGNRPHQFIYQSQQYDRSDWFG